MVNYIDIVSKQQEITKLINEYQNIVYTYYADIVISSPGQIHKDLENKDYLWQVLNQTNDHINNAKLNIWFINENAKKIGIDSNYIE